jgi:2'-5' RNA ligase
MSRQDRRTALRDASHSSTSRADWAPWSVATPGGQVFPSPIPIIGPVEAEGLLLRDWRANREITQPAGDLMRKGVKIDDLPPWVDLKSLKSWIEGDSITGKIGLRGALTEWWAEGESYGGAVLVAVVDDGRAPSEPLDRANLRTILSWEVIDRWCCWPYRRGGMGSPIDYWVISSEHLPLQRTTQIVHPSRVVVHTGRWMPRRWRDTQDGWGASRLELLLDQRNTLRKGHQAIGRLLDRTSQDVVVLAEYSEMVAEYGEAYMKDRARVHATTLEDAAVMFLDGGITADAAGNRAGREPDKFESVPRPLSGVDGVENVQHSDWRRGSGMPSVVADGDAAAGLNGGVEAGPWRAWDGYVDALFEKDILPALNWGLGLIFAAKEGPTRGRVPETWTATRAAIAEPDYKLEAEIAEIETRTDQAQQEAGQLTPEEIRQARNVDAKHGRVRVESADLLPEPGTEALTGELENTGAEVQQLALNGAQMSALLEITAAVTANTLPAAVAEWLIGLSVPGIAQGPAKTALHIASAYGKANPELVAPPPSGSGFDAAVTFARVFNVERRDLLRAEPLRHMDGEDPVGVWACAMADRIALQDRHEDPAAGVFVQLPDALACRFPYKPKDTSPPHCTVLYIGPTSWDQITEVREVAARLAGEMKLLPCRARLGSLGYFEKPDGSRVAWVGVEFDPALDEYHARLRADLMAEGVMVQHRDGPWVAHVTLGYLAPGEDFAGVVPSGEWTVERFEVWHGEH